MIIVGDSLSKLKEMRSNSIHCCVTSPPYWGLRDYGVKGQLGLEKSPDEYVTKLCEVFREVRRVLKKDGTLWLNLGDTYASTGGCGHQGKHGERNERRHTQQNVIGNSVKKSGLKMKDLIGIPWRVAFALQSDGWYLRQDIIWHKPNPMPESVRDRCTKAHEYLFLFAKSRRYYFDNKAFQEPCESDAYDIRRMKEGRPRTGGKWFDKSQKDDHFRMGGKLGHQNKVGNGEMRNRRSVWKISTRPFKGAHFAVFPIELVEPCILAGTKKLGTVLDPFFGAGTTGMAAIKHGRKYIGIELNPKYARLAKNRLEKI